MPQQVIVLLHRNNVVSNFFGAFLAKTLMRGRASCDTLFIVPYLNEDFNSVSMEKYGECYVLKDGTVTDLSVGVYERILNRNFDSSTFITFGKVIKEELKKINQGYYFGEVRTISESLVKNISETIKNISGECLLIDINLDYFSKHDIDLLLKGIRATGKNIWRWYIFIGYYSGRDESYTQIFNDIKSLQKDLLAPDVFVIITRVPLEDYIKEKLREDIRLIREDGEIYFLEGILHPYQLYFYKEVFRKIANKILKRELSFESPVFEKIATVYSTGPAVKIALVTKYANIYANESLYDSIIHTVTQLGYSPQIFTIHSMELEKVSLDIVEKILSKFDGIVVGTGFGVRGTAGIIRAIKVARENRIPFLGIGYGFELAVIEYAKHVLGITDATSEEIQKTGTHIFIENPLAKKHKDVNEKIIRGLKKIILDENTRIYKIYNEKVVYERVRHRYVLNPDYLEVLNSSSGKISGYYELEDGFKVYCYFELPEDEHPFFIGALPHIDMNCRPESIHPLIEEFCKKVIERSKERKIEE